MKNWIYCLSVLGFVLVGCETEERKEHGEKVPSKEMKTQKPEEAPKALKGSE